MTNGWMIAAGELRIPYGTPVAAHRMLLVVDPRGRVVRQMNGLASWLDPASGKWRHKPIGYLRTDRLRAYDTRERPETFLPVHGCTWGSADAGAAIARGHVQPLVRDLSAERVDAWLAPAVKAAGMLNGLSGGPEGGGGLPYPFLGFGPNSNSVFVTLLSAMGLDAPGFATSAWLVPGHRNLLLPQEALRTLASASPAGGGMSGSLA